MLVALRICRRVWFPLFLLFGVSWLFAPAYYGDHYGTLQLISAYEGGAKHFSWLFRLSDIVSAALLIGAPWLFDIRRKDRRLAWMILAAGLLSAIDAIFADRCSLSAAGCSGWLFASTGVHVVESVLLGALLVGMGMYHARTYGRVYSWLFVAAQALLGLLVVSSLLSSQQIVVLEYAYEVLIVGWLAWVVGHFVPPMPLGRTATFLRQLFGAWALINGALAIVVALTHRELVGVLFDVSISHQATIVAQHGVLAGILMLYLARQVYVGQRRAALLLLALFAVEVIKYSVVSPSPVLLSIYLLSFALLLYGHRLFDRNTVPLPLAKRLEDVGLVVAGVFAALLISQAVASLAGHRGILTHGAHLFVADPARVTIHRADIYEDHAGHRAHVLAQTVLTGGLALVAWGLFRPARFRPHSGIADRERMRQLLERFGASTEDYFKLWPEDKSYFFATQVEGAVAYKVVGAQAFALADPVAAVADKSTVLDQFVRHCRRHGWSACFLLIDEADRALYEADLKLLRIGSSALVDTATFVELTGRDKWWRWRRNRAEKAGLRYEVLIPPYDERLLGKLAAVSDSWLADGKTEQSFALGYFDRSYLRRCRLHVVYDAAGQPLAFANELPVLHDDGQRTVDMIRHRPEQDSAMPYLLQSVIGQLYKEGIKHFDLGFVPLAGLDAGLVKVVRRLAAARYSSLGLEQFKNKFDPVWRANYLAYDGDLVDLALIAASLEQALKVPDANRAKVKAWSR